MPAAQSSPVSGFVFVVAVLATSIVLVAALAWASRQLLGLPVGTLRALIVIVAAEVLVPSGIRATLEQDLDILQRLAVRLERRARWARAVGAASVARGFAASGTGNAPGIIGPGNRDHRTAVPRR
jgi:hypothetical protein